MSLFRFDPRNRRYFYKGELFLFPVREDRFVHEAGAAIVASTLHSHVPVHTVVVQSTEVHLEPPDCLSCYSYNYRLAHMREMPPTSP